MRTKQFFALGILFVAAGLLVFYFYNQKQERNLPPPQTYNQAPPEETAEKTAPPASGLAAEINLAIPFTSQAPFKVWDEAHGEFCEEASVLMASHYILGKSIPSPEYADAELLKIKDWEEQKFGYYKDTTAEETAIILKEYFQISQVRVLYNPSLTDIKQAVAASKAVIVPAAGRQLPNPNFRSPGPLYHMLVVKGYMADGRIITNDPGTRLGADFIYEASALMNAMHDWNNGDVDNGQKVVIIVG